MYLTQGIHRSARLYPHKTAVVFGDRRQTWSELMDRVARYAAVLKEAGLKRGDRVTIIAHNSDRYIETYFAVWWAGGVIVPGNTRWAVPEHVYALEDSGTSFLIVDDAFAPMVPALTAACSFRKIFYLGEQETPDGMVNVAEAIDRAEPAADECGEGDELCSIFYTGGTTGRSKGVMLSHGGLFSNMLMTNGVTPYSADIVMLHSPPMFHLADGMAVISTTVVGGTHVVVPFFTPQGVVDTIVKERINCVLLVPTMLGMVRDHVLQNPSDLSGVGRVLYGASPISEALLRDSMDVFPNAEFVQAYGQTEVACCATLLEPQFHRLGGNQEKNYLRSAGRPILGLDLKIVDEEMNEVETGAVGEVALRGPSVMLGYWNQPELTARTIVDGWLRTGDAGRVDEDGFLFLVDRVKDMIVSGGENVYSAEVENAISAHPAVAECAVIGVPDPKWGERVHGIVRLKPGKTLSESELIAHCHELIAGYKCPRSVDFREEALPLSGAGKILKTELRKPYWEGTARAIG